MNDAIKGLTKLVGSEQVTASEHQLSTLAVAIGVAFATSKFTRSRAERGVEPVLGFF